MGAVSETIVREYFELHGFFVRQQRKFVAPNRREDEEVDFLVFNPQPEAGRPPAPFVLTSADLRVITRAVVVVKGWHTETFSPAVLANAPEIFRFVESASFRQTARAFGPDGPLLKLLVVPALPQHAAARDQSVELLRGKGIDGVIPFRTMLSDLIDRIEINRNYQKSDLLQVIRILKNYDFFKEPQLELFKSARKRRAKPEANGEADARY
ncbi:MAG: hypothetical protein KGS61_19635 [Verrucomicrobia bacterium]|nr:hypothetical protein [Verrucomicrobiota bacterium]